MADKKITELPPATAVAPGDLIPIVSDPLGVPVTQKATVSQLQSALAPFSDSTALLMGSVDPTKLLRFEVDGFTAGQTRILTPPDQDFTIAGLEVLQTFSVTQTITPAVNTSALALSGYSLTGSNASSELSLAGTWNTTGAPTALDVNITNTASSSVSRLFRLRLSGVDKFAVQKDGETLMGGGSVTAFADGTFFAASSDFQVNADASFYAAAGRFAVNATGEITSNLLAFVKAIKEFRITPAVNTSALAVSGYSLTGANAQPLVSLLGTWNTSGAPTGILLDITNTLSVGSSLMRLATNTVDRFKVSSGGEVGIFPTPNLTPLTVSGYSLTGASFVPMISLSGTWNTTGDPTAIDLNITDTASNSGKLLTLRVGGAEKFRVDKDGSTIWSGGFAELTAAGRAIFANSNFVIEPDGSFTAATGGVFTVAADGAMQLGSSITFAASGSVITDNSPVLEFSHTAIKISTITLEDDAAGHLRISTGTTIQFGVDAVSESATQTHTLLIKDGQGTVYRVLLADQAP